jgi:hypothetical protein
MEQRPFWITSLHMFAGVIVWAVHFTAIYSFTALACARGFAQMQWLGMGVVTWVIGGATLVAATATLVILVPALRTARRSFESWMAAGIAALALIAILWETLPVMMLPVCR